MFFGLSKNDPWAEGADSPRPPSTASSDNHLLPRPSAETQSMFGWPVSGGDSSNQRSSPLAANWGLGPPPSNGWASRLHSRNASSQYPLGLEGPISEHEDGPAQAPIGTRPSTGHVKNSLSNAAAKLNPAAPTFKTLFTRSAEKKPEKIGKNKKEKSKQQERESLDIDDGSRVSRDGRSISTVDYSSDAARESLDYADSSATPSETGASSNQNLQPKESFMQKLSRKSSAGFTTLAGRKGRNKAGQLDAIDVNGTPDDEMSRSVASTLSPEDRGAPSPSLSTPGTRGFKFRSIRRRKLDKATDGEGDESLIDVESEASRIGKS